MNIKVTLADRRALAAIAAYGTCPADKFKLLEAKNLCYEDEDWYFLTTLGETILGSTPYMVVIEPPEVEPFKIKNLTAEDMKKIGQEARKKGLKYSYFCIIDGHEKPMYDWNL